MREHLLDTALDLFTGNGYHETTMRDIAAAAGCSPGLTYRYFARKEDLVVALYQRLAHEFEERVMALPPMSLAERFEQVMQLRLRQVTPYRGIYQAILGSALSPQNDLGILGDNTLELRARAQAMFTLVVEGASDAPSQQQVEELAQVLYAVHLCFVLFWLYDRSPQQHATDEMLSLACDALRLGRRLLRLRPVSRALTRLTRAITPVFGVEAISQPAAPRAHREPPPAEWDDEPGELE
ncbi:MAG: TetR/AcrR family transcriptional regulator [Chloroflexaceae bacterium]|nr:TetR/AcrR family transcriptional regulator [Chloroflexaceae bacterium]NJO05416.1 TetR/AcrR family transcriptional regulator [Chloroflexaceae bacterium]